MASTAIPLLYERDTPTSYVPGAVPGAVNGSVIVIPAIQTIDNRPKLNLTVPAPGAPGTSSVIKNPA